MTLPASGPDWTLCRDGDAALTLAFAPRIDPAVNARCLALAAAVRGWRLRAVRDVVEAFAAVTVHLDPVAGDVEAVAAALVQAVQTVQAAPPPLAQADDAAPRPAQTIPVCYGGAFGPDLDEVARFARCSPDEVIARHGRPVYRVYMLGFQAGFAYLGAVDPRIAMPRRPTPRFRVPAGAVGIAGGQTGVYPVASPGGWRLLGRTPVRVVDLDRPRPFLLAPGDRVRFTPIDRAAYDRLAAGRA